MRPASRIVRLGRARSRGGCQTHHGERKTRHSGARLGYWPRQLRRLRREVGRLHKTAGKLLDAERKPKRRGRPRTCLKTADVALGAEPERLGELRLRQPPTFPERFEIHEPGQFT